MKWGTCWMTALLCLLVFGGCGGCVGNGGSGDPVCEPQVKKCDGNDVIRCNSGGTDWEFWKECDNDKSCLDGECIASVQPDVTTDVVSDASPEVIGDLVADLALPDTVIDVSGDTSDTLHEVQVDGVTLDICQPSCSEKECGDDGCGGSCGECDDNNMCTDDTCVEGACSFENNVADCDDGNPCTVNDACAEGECHGDFLPGDQLSELNCTCEVDADCDPVENVDICDGTLHCVEEDIDGEMKMVCSVDTETIPDCDDQIDCTVDGCDPLEWCQWTPDHEYCDDGNVCTEDTCLTEGTTGCSNTVLDDGTACDEGWECQGGVCTCVPDCEGKVCGPDGCDGSCGTCGGAQDECIDGICICQPACEGIECGADGCGGDCGPCEGDQDICIEGDCVCIPDCTDKVCGSNGCGGSCGTCGQDEECDAQGQCVESSGLVWKPIPGGTFMMGCSPGDGDCDSDEKPSHSVTLSPFDILETEVTEAQYLAVTGDDPSCDWGAGGGPDSPVECVDWYEGKDFCEAVGGRLCTEAEWEYAARGGTTTKYYCGNSSGCLDGIAWWDDNSGSHKHDVKGKAPNAYGLYDMLGNVWEWTADWYDKNYYLSSPANNPQGPNSGSARVKRGGSFDFGGVGGGSLRVSDRDGVNPSYVYDTRGLRCCRSE